MTELIASMRYVNPGVRDMAMARMENPETKKRFSVSGKSSLFQNLVRGELVKLRGEWVSDRIKLHGYNLQDSPGIEYFEAVGCSKIYSDKVIDVLGD
jgi:hypothetical protein